MVCTRLSKATMMFLSPITDPVTDCSMNLSVVNTKTPAAMAPAMGKPTSPTSVRNSIMCIFNICTADRMCQHSNWWKKPVNTDVRVLAIILLYITTASADQLHHEFGNPSFSGNGYSNHVLSIEQLQYSRAQTVKEDAKSADAAAEREAKNTTINKFITNVESRIYANLSKQLVDNMFGTSCTGTCPTSGTAEVEGSTIYWVKDASTEIITLTITDPSGNVTTMSVPLGDFNF